MIQLWLYLWLCLTNLGWAQESSEVGTDDSLPAAMWAAEAETETAGERQRFSIQVYNSNERPKPGVLLLLGFQEIEEQTGRPLPGAAPDFELVLEREPAAFPRAYELWLLPTLNWYVVASVDVPANQDAWMSDALLPELGEVELVLGAKPSEPDPDAGEDLGADADVGLGEPQTRMNWGGLLILALIPLVTGWAIGSGPKEKPLSHRQLVGLVGVAGVVFLCMSEFWLANHHLDHVYSSYGFLESCEGVLTLAEPDQGWPSGRSRLAGLLPFLLSGWLGPVDALRVVSVLSTMFVGAGIFAWARMFGGTVAGWAALAAALTIGPMTHLPRMLSFYPVMTVVFTWAGAACSWALLNPSQRSSVWAGVAIGLCGLIDARGLPFALMLGTVVGLSHVLRYRNKAGWPLIALCLPLLFSWSLGRMVYPAQSESLEKQLQAFEEVGSPLSPFQSDGDDTPFVESAAMDGESLIWGRTPPSAIPSSLWGLAKSWPIVADQNREEAGEIAVETQVGPWLPVALFTVPLAMCGAWRPRRWLGVSALGLSMLPAGIGLAMTVDALAITTHAPARFFAQFGSVLAVCMGLAWVYLLRAIPHSGKWTLGPIPHRVLVALLMITVVTGWLPNPLSPNADWRYAWRGGGEYEEIAERAAAGSLSEQATGSRCIETLEQGSE